MHNSKYSTPSYETPCLIHIKDLGWIEAEMSLEEDTGDMYYPLSGLNVIRYEVWYSKITDDFYPVESVDYWIYMYKLSILDIDHKGEEDD